MSPSDAPDDAAAPTLQYGTASFDEQVRRVITDESQAGARILFRGGTRELRQKALAQLIRHATGTIHQVEVPALLDEQREQTQNNLRKAFDHAAEENAVLYLDRADPILSPQTTDSAEDEAIPSIREYVFDRASAYDGTVVFGLQEAPLTNESRSAVDLVIHFG